MALKISKNTFAEAKALAEGGDIDPKKTRALYERVCGRPTNLPDEALLVAEMTEDDDDEERIARIKQIELEGFEIVA